MRKYLAIAALVFCSSLQSKVWNSNGSISDVNTQIGNAGIKDVVTVPGSSSFTWGAGGSAVILDKEITLLGLGQAPDQERGALSSSTVINIDATANTGTGTIQISAAATLRGFTFNQPAGGSNTRVISTTGNGWRVTNVTYTGTATIAQSQYLVNGNGYGVIDHSTITGATGSDEWLFFTGQSDSWQTINSMGTDNCVDVETCIFNSNGYPDFNANARGLIRFTTITGPMKVDGHGLASNTPPRGVRQVEFYKNDWTQATGTYPSIEARGGTGRIWGNTTPNTSGSWFYLTDYGYLAQWPNFGSVFQTPNNYSAGIFAIGDQIGTGKDITIAASAIHQWEMIRIVSQGSGPATDFTTIGAPNNTAGTQFIATGTPTGNGTATTAPAAAEPVYVVGNLQSGGPWVRTLHIPDPGAITFYGSSFTEPNLIQANRDFYADSGFDTSQPAGASSGTTAAMNAFSAPFTGYIWMATDQGTWNLTAPPGLSSGVMYRASAPGLSHWVLNYVPLQYPAPATQGTPVASVYIGGYAVRAQY